MDATAHPTATTTSPPQAQAALATGLSRLRRRTSIVATERWLLVAGSVLVPLGGLLVLLGWYGAAHTTRLFEEIPYLISGGLFGVLLVVAGACAYFAYWLAHLLSTERQVLDVLLRIEARMDGDTPSETQPAARVTFASVAAAAADRPAPALVATRAGTQYHRADCPVVTGRPPEELRTIEGAPAGLRPCRICSPAVVV